MGERPAPGRRPGRMGPRGVDGGRGAARRSPPRDRSAVRRSLGRSERRRLRCVVGDRSVFFTAGLTFVLADDDVAVVGAAEDPAQLPELVAALHPDVVIAAFEPTSDAIAVVPGVQPYPVLVLSWSRRSADLLAALRGGARGFLQKDIRPDDLTRGLRDIVAGRTVMPPGGERVLIDRIDARIVPRQRHDDRVALTSRELEILDLMIQGASNKDIARHLGIALQTVKNHTRSMLNKVQLSSRSQLVAWATGRGLVPVARPEQPAPPGTPLEPPG